MTVVQNFLNLLARRGSDFIFHREDWQVPCPCRTPEGYRDPEWHLANPLAPVCNEEGMLSGDTTHISAKGFIQPIQSTRATRLSTEFLDAIFGEVQADDHLGILPVNWANQRLEFRDWGGAGEDYVEYHGRRYTVVNANLIPDPSDGNPEHHWELGLRLLESA
jgi:hypothetical protein